MKRKALLIIMLLAFVATGAMKAQQTLTVYENTTTTANNVPMFVNYFHRFTKAQTIFPATDLAAMAGKTITDITFYTTDANFSGDYTTQSSAEIYLAEVENPTFSTTTFINKSSATIVKTGYYTFVSDGNGGYMVTITFDTPYPYNGGNLLFGCDNQAQTNGNKNINFKGITATGASLSAQGTSVPSSGNQRGFLPKTTFTYTFTPTNLQVGSVTTQSATLTWQAPEDTDIESYSYSYKKHSDSEWSSDYTTSDTEATLNNLDPGTEYDFRVKALYSGNHETPYVTTTFFTDCDVITVSEDTPWTENFESFYYTQIAGGLTNDAKAKKIDDGCWDAVIQNGSPAMYAGNYIHACGGTSATNQNTVQFYNNKTGLNPAMLILPEFDDISNLKFEFYGSYATASGTLQVGYCTYTNETWNFTSTTGDGFTITTGRSADPQTYGPYYFVGAPSGSRIALKYTPVNQGGCINLDEFIVSIVPSCDDPTNLANTDVTATTASFSWTGSGDFEYVCVPQGNTPDWSNATSTSNTSVTLEGLSAGTNYDFYVRKVCFANLLYSDAVMESFTTETVIITYNITVIANEPTWGTVSGGGTYNDHETATLTATPASKYFGFVNWTKNGEVVSTDATITFTVTEDATYVANFENLCEAITIVEGTPWTENFDDENGYNFYYTGPSYSNTTVNFSNSNAYKINAGCWDVDNAYDLPVLYAHDTPAAFSNRNSVQFLNRGGIQILILPEFTNDLNTLQFEFKGNYVNIDNQGTLEIGYYYGNAFHAVCTSERITCGRGSSGHNAIGDYMGPYPLTGEIPSGSRMALRYTPIDTTIHTNTGVATGCINLDDFRVSITPVFTKTIVGVGEENWDGENGGYYLIASPLAEDVTPNADNGFIVGDYDLYYFSQTGDSEGNEWINFKDTENGGFSIVNGTGYLYASKEGTTLTFTGAPCSSDGTVTLSKTTGAEFAGHNLVGNPFGEDAYITKSFYTLENSDTYSPNTAEVAIHAMQGLLVVANEDGETLTFSTEAPAKAAKLNMNVTKGRALVDQAIISFNEGQQLPKLQFRNGSTKVYIPQEGKDYAIVSAESSMGEMPVNFKAENNGTYTLSFTTEEVSFAYLHLIDNMTGIETDLLANPSYSFDARTTDYESRFKLVFATGNNANDDNFAFFSNGSFVINNEGEATLQVIDMNGRILKSESINGCANVNVKAAAGVYMLRLVNGNDVKVQKVVVR